MTIGKFQALKHLGTGQFGAVYHAYDPMLNVERAIKVIKVKDAAGFLAAMNEAQILEKCRHHHIVDVKEMDLHDVGGAMHPCIITEYLKEGSAQDYLEKNFVTVEKAIQIISDCLFALEHAHSQGIFHRDIKPGNILFDQGRAKLADFGLAYGLPHQTFSFQGYSSHLPPEALDGTAQDSVSDLYSMGMTFHRLINNIQRLNMPFSNIGELTRAIKNQLFPERRFELHIPDSITRIIKKSIKPNRSDRFQNCLQFRQAIQKISLAIEWKPINNDQWVGVHKQDRYEITLFSKRTGICIDFKRNNRKQNDRCCVQIADLGKAQAEFYKTIRETTLKIS